MIAWLSFFVCWVVSFLFRRDRSRPALDRSGAAASPCQTATAPPQSRSIACSKQPERLLVTVLLVTNFADIVGLCFFSPTARLRVWRAGYRRSRSCRRSRFIFSCSAFCRSRSFGGFRFAPWPPSAACSKCTSALLWPVLELGERIGRSLPAGERKPPALCRARRTETDCRQSEREGSLTSTERAMIHNVSISET